MVVVRPVKPADLESLIALAAGAGAGLTTLPRDPQFLRKRIEISRRSFESPAEKPSGESYLFAMEDTERGQVVGACGIVSKVGGFEPFYAYQLRKSLFSSDVIHVHKEVPILKLLLEHNGPCEIGSLFLDPAYRGSGNGRFLQLVRFLFMAEHPERFETTVVSEIRGVLTEDGHSPFWDALGEHFFDIDFQQADHLSIVNKKFIADLMPDHPIYIPILPESAQAVIGKPHPDSARAVKNLEEEGFRFSNMVDIFDAGPILSCKRDRIRSIRRSRRGAVGSIVAQAPPTQDFMLARVDGEFRATKTPLAVKGDGVVVPKPAAEAIGVQSGDPVRFVELYPTRRH